MSPKILGTGEQPLKLGSIAGCSQEKYSLPTSLHAKFGRSTSNSIGICRVSNKLGSTEGMADHRKTTFAYDEFDYWQSNGISINMTNPGKTVLAFKATKGHQIWHGSVEYSY